MSDYLFELGCEELPASQVNYLIDQFNSIWHELLKKQRIDYDSIEVYTTPRRIALYTSGLTSLQKSVTSLRLGPWHEQAFDEHGQPTKAAIGFAKSCQVAIDKLDLIEEKGKKRLAFKVKLAGKPTADILPQLIADIFLRLHLPQTMRWGSSTGSFIRPIRWLCSVLDDRHLPVSLFEQESTNYSRGHRFLHPNNIKISNAADYCQLLEYGKVIADHQRRKQLILDQVATIAKNENYSACLSQELIEELTHLVEWPVALLCSFDSTFLRLPEKVLTATMVKHQRYIPLYKEGKIQPSFITIANMTDQTSVIAKGNERVLRPRLNDAVFFLEQDLELGIDAMATKLNKVTFEASLGNIAQRSLRIEYIAVALAKHIIQLSGKQNLLDINKLITATRLAKADLVSFMVDEIPELQGYAGGYYAQQAGYCSEISDALTEQYKPIFAKDELPRTLIGKILALADRLDLLAGFFLVGKKPTPDKDPYGLRRAALATVRIAIVIKHLPDLPTLIEIAMASYHSDIKTDDLTKFIIERMRSLYLEEGKTASVFLAVATSDYGNIFDFNQRIELVQKISLSSSFNSLTKLIKRITNILGNNTTTHIDQSLFTEVAEQHLYTASQELESQLQQASQAGEYQQYLNKLTSLERPVDQFFDQVMVNCEDKKIRKNRLALLQQVHNQCTRIVDITLLD